MLNPKFMLQNKEKSLQKWRSGHDKFVSLEDIVDNLDTRLVGIGAGLKKGKEESDKRKGGHSSCNYRKFLVRIEHSEFAMSLCDLLFSER